MIVLTGQGIPASLPRRMRNGSYMKYIISCLVLAAGLAFASSTMAQPIVEATQEVRNTAALTHLTEKPDTVAIYAQGLCCLSCAIGVRKKVKKLAFVDLSRLEDGIELDVETQIVTVAVKKNAKIDPAALTKAIDDAGYEPVHLYTLNAGKLVTQPLTKK